MNIVLIGPPGAGKGTQAKLIISNYSIPHLSTGDIFRKNIANGTELGIEAQKHINKGNLVPDELTIKIVEDVLEQDIYKNGFLMDGFPRTVKQAEALDNILKLKNQKLDAVLLIDVPMNFILDRMTGRRVCLSCGASYHTKYNPPKSEGVCNLCNGNLIQRKDDSEETVRGRLEVYANITKPLIQYYEARNQLYRIDGTMSIDKVFENISSVLGREN